MTNLSPEQQALLYAVELEKEKAREHVAKAKLEYEKAKWDIEASLRFAVKKAVEKKVPKRKLGQVLGTSDHKTVDNMAKGAGKKFSNRP